jgi:hypothetical protein
MSSARDYEYVFLNVQVLQTAYNRGYASYGSIGRRGRGRRNQSFGRRPDSPYIVAGPGYMQKCRVLPVQVARSPREGEASKLGRHSIWSCQRVQVWSSRACSLRQGRAYGGGSVLVKAAP